MYESAGTRWFKLGRTDVVRNTSIEAHTFVKTMTDPHTTVQIYYILSFIPM